jgi:folate-binding protein YgfZ
VDPASVAAQIQALEAGRGVLDLDGWSATQLRGDDATRWLNDLVTASVESLQPGETVRSLLLGPTGRIRADVHVGRWNGGFLLLQGPGQPDPIGGLLDPYVLSSDVELAPARVDGLAVTPRPGPHWLIRSDRHGGIRVGADAFEAWRVRHAIPRFPADVDEGSLPAEAGLDEEPVIDRAKGCYLGQESVARIRNLGHPRRLVLAVLAEGSVHIGERVFSTGADVGIVTSADPAGPAAFVRIRWEARDSGLTTGDGVALRRP